MGTEAIGEVVQGPALGEVKADLGSDHVAFRGAFRGVVGYRDLHVAREGTRLRLAFDNVVVMLDLGLQAERWERRMRHPPTRMERLGIADGARVAVLGSADADFLAEARAIAEVSAEVTGADVVVLSAASRDDLGGIDGIERRMGPEAAIWIVYPKGVPQVREADVMAAGRSAGLKDVKVARFSDRHTALKFVRPKA